MRDFERAVDLLELVLRYHPCGLAVIMGKSSPPDVVTWDKLLTAMRSGSGGQSAPIGTGNQPAHDPLISKVAQAAEMDRIVDTMGGWETISKAAQAISTEAPTLWLHFVTHLDKVEGLQAVRLGSEETTHVMTARTLGISPRTLTNHRRVVPQLIARKTLNDFQMPFQW